MYEMIVRIHFLNFVEAEHLKWSETNKWNKKSRTTVKNLIHLCIRQVKVKPTVGWEA